jgi:hypothetical protein
LDRFVALKILPPEMGADAAFAERFVREGRALAKLMHPNIVAVHDFGQAGRYFYIIMEFVDGVNLRQAMRNGLTPREVLTIVPKVCEALQYAHENGVLHRDIKPENILIDTRGQVKIADFGVAKMAGDQKQSVTLTQSGSSLGTPHYMAPEQIENAQDVDHRADIYSLGVVFYEMLTGGLPLGRFPAPSVKSGADPRLDSVVLRTLEKERENRYQSAVEMKTEVETVARNPVPSIPPPQLPPQAILKGTGPLSLKALFSLIFVSLAVPIVLLSFVSVQGVTTYQAAQHGAAAPSLVNDTPEVEAGGSSLSDPNAEFERRRRERLNAMEAKQRQDQAMTVRASGLRLLVMVLTVLPILLGTALGFWAISDIRRSNGVMRGAGMAAFGAGFLPLLLLVGLGVGLGMLLREITGVYAQRGNLVIFMAAAGGCWAGILLMRNLFRQATCWLETPATVATAAAKEVALGQMALWFAIAGTICAVLAPQPMVQFGNRMVRATAYSSPLWWVAIGLLITSVVLGFIAGNQPRAKAARILGSIMIFIIVITLA